MDKDVTIVKMDGYDKFKCSADKCSLTCCEGWDISVDNDTYKKWIKDEKLSSAVLEDVKKSDGRDVYEINKDTSKACPFLCSDGLCRIVKTSGEDYLSKTCHTFPRIINEFEGKAEYTLSCACPEAVEIISEADGKFTAFHEDNINDNEAEGNDESLKSCIRRTLIDIISMDGFGFYDKLIAGYQMIIDVLDSEDIDDNLIAGAVERFREASYIERIIEGAKADYGDFTNGESVEEINNFFVDITENYKEVEGISSVIGKLYGFAEEIETGDFLGKWKSFKNDFSKYEKLMEKCAAVKIIGSCISDDIIDTIMAYQAVVIEMLLVRYAAFLKSCIEEVTEEDVKQYTAVITRIIGNNAEAFEEFIEDGFDSSVLDIGYLCFAADLRAD